LEILEKTDDRLLLSTTKFIPKPRIILFFSIFVLILFFIGKWYSYSNSKLYINCTKANNLCTVVRHQFPNINEALYFKLNDLYSVNEIFFGKVNFCFKNNMCKSIYAGDAGRSTIAPWYVKTFIKEAKKNEDFKLNPSKLPNNIILLIFYLLFVWLVAIVFVSYFIKGYNVFILFDKMSNKILITRFTILRNIKKTFILNDLKNIEIVELNTIFKKSNEAYNQLILEFPNHKEKFLVLKKSDLSSISEIKNFVFNHQ